MPAERRHEHAGATGVPYGMPAEVVRLGDPSIGRGVPYVSDTPWKPDRADRPTCQGTRTNGLPCKQIVFTAGNKNCDAHIDQE